jgi:hypothetical protein
MEQKKKSKKALILEEIKTIFLQATPTVEKLAALPKEDQRWIKKKINVWAIEMGLDQKYKAYEDQLDDDEDE